MSEATQMFAIVGAFLLGAGALGCMFGLGRAVAREIVDGARRRALARQPFSRAVTTRRRDDA